MYRKQFLPQVKGLFGSAKASSLPTFGKMQSALRQSVSMERVFHQTEPAAYIEVELPSFKQALAYTREWTALRVNWLNSAIVGGRAPVAVAAPVDEGYYTLESSLGGFLGVKRASREELANVEITAVDGMPAQPFRLEAVGKAATGETLYRIVSVLSGKALAVDAKGNVVQARASKAPGQRWMLRTWAGKGRFALVNAANQKVLDVEGGASARGVNVLTWDLNAGPNQLWLLKQ